MPEIKVTINESVVDATTSGNAVTVQIQDAPIQISAGVVGISGYSGYSGASPGTSGFSGASGKSGFSGTTGFSGSSGAPGGTSGYSGASGKSGYSGTSGFSGKSGFSGASGFSGVSGAPNTGASGFSGTSGFSGISGYSGASGKSGFSGAGTAGTYAPTFTSVANLDSTPTGGTAQYSNVAGVITVSGEFVADPTLTATQTSFGISLPVASNFAQTYQCGGTAFCGAIAGMGATINGDVANDRANVSWVSSDVNSNTWSYHFTYLVI